MADPAPPDAEVQPMPRWVKVGGVATLALVLLFVLLHLMGLSPGGHGP